MKALIGKWGRSAAVRLPRAYLEALGLEPGDEVELTLERGKLVMASRAQPTLDELVALMKRQERPEIIDAGPDLGAEVIDD